MDSKPTIAPIRKAEGNDGDSFELHQGVGGVLELWAYYGEWIFVGSVSHASNMETAVANHEEELRCMV